MLAGACLGGQRGVLLLQSSGVGNCINMLSLPVICHMPLLMLVIYLYRHFHKNLVGPEGGVTLLLLRVIGGVRWRPVVSLFRPSED